MKFTDSLEGDIVCFEMSGKIMGGENTTLFYGKVCEYVNLNKKSIILDMAKVDWINSIGLGMLITALTTTRNAGGHLVLCNIDKIENLLTVTRLITVFDHFDSREQATASFSN
ncbi:MAG: STAS domain-containing protein [candidate division Zixibacteria bacterium]|nr:STAS domain-containing protein [candidate division Zixibacteria bacterium]